MTEPNPQNSGSPAIARRNIVKGAAWAVPVIAAATTVPFASASTDTEDGDFYVTAFQVTGIGTNGQIRSNGVRISPEDPANPKVIPAGTIFSIVVTYTGDMPEMDFTNPQYGVDYNKGQNPSWPTIDVTTNTITFTAVTQTSSSEPVIGSFAWFLPAGVRPEDNSITVAGTATIPASADYPDGAVLTDLMVDPNEGTGALSGPTETTWPS
ncbi:hypothetical protein [Glutamicibacter sp.]|uniref:hypothetical protein n=1 Tax=Glutamicibacter sp. TaxID=1931995 RepID=UPI0028BD3DF9|nr:hypothetical protein [Glutamicibacter sp.]